MSWFWDYSHLSAPHPYGPDLTYQEAAEFLDYGPVEDWGCGSGYAKRFFPKGYIGIDQAGPFADIVTNLCDYTSETPGILLRHVLEHNLIWDCILINALQSAKKVAVVLFTPVEEETRIITATENERGRVLDIAIGRRNLRHILESFYCKWQYREYETGIAYGKETLFTITCQDKRK